VVAWLASWRRLIGAIVLGLVVSFLFSIPVLYWFQNEVATYVGVFYTIVVGVATFILAMHIADSQNQLQQRVMERIFGTMAEFDDVYDKVVELIKEANQKNDSELAIMVYWLWFGVDRRLEREHEYEVSLDEINPNDSEFRLLLEQRRLEGQNTTVVVYHRNALPALHRFVKAAFNWQVDKLPPPRSTSKRTINPADVESLVQRYMEDLKDFDKRRIETTDTQFKPLRLRNVIPMLMFAGRARRSNWCRGLIYLGETEALEKGAKTGGFMSSDPQIVEVILSQILALQEDETPEVPPLVA
jgi:hypothetical protein